MTNTENNPLGGKDFIETLIPQRFPFVMVDTLYSYSETELVSGFTIPNDCIFLENGVFAASGVIEHMAQTVALHTGYQFFLTNMTAPTGYIGSIKDITITKLPEQNNELITTIYILQEFAGITLVDIVTKLNDAVIAKGQMKTVLAK